MALSLQGLASLLSKHALRLPSPTGTYFLCHSNANVHLQVYKPACGQRPHSQVHVMHENTCHLTKPP